MWIVQLALRRPYTFIVMSLLIILVGGVTLTRMPTDVFPEIDIPVIAAVWNYGGLPPDEIEKRITSNYERALTTTVNDIEHIESQSLTGVSVIKVFFQPGAKIEAATAQVTAISQTVLRQMPPGATPPLVMRYSASSVPILQASLASDTLSEQQIFDLSNNFLRTGLAVVQGAQIPFAFGGKQRQIMVDLDPERLYAYGLSAADVSSRLGQQNLILPAGTVKLGGREYSVRVNSSPDTVPEFNALPLRSTGGVTLYLRDVAHVRDGFSPQTSIVHVNGKRGALLPILKAGGASTLDIVSRVRATLPGVLATLPSELKLTLLFDQSVFVRAAVAGVVKEAAIAAALTALMILIFLGSWRATVIVALSIPLSILVSIIALGALGQTLNVMTLGGMALAVGILVDDATVGIENIYRNLGEGQALVPAILSAAQQIAVPTLVSTLCICIVFVPVAFIAGAARSLFTPMAMAVVFAMLTSYLLSRTLVPTLVMRLLGAEVARHHQHGEAADHGLLWRVHTRFNRRFDALRAAYGQLLQLALAHRRGVLLGSGAFVLLSLVMLNPLLGHDFFPVVDAGQLRLHVRCPAGTRIEETERYFARIEDAIRAEIPARELGTVLDNIGVPVSGINLALGDPSMVSAADGEILIALKEERSTSSASYARRLRRRFRADFPEVDTFFLAPDIATQVLNFGLSAPIDIQISGPGANQEQNRQIARKLRDELARVPGAVDVHLHQVTAAPEVRIDVERTLSDQLGLTQRDVAGNVLVSLSSSTQTAPSFWLDAKKGVQYAVAVQTPQRLVASLAELGSTPVTLPGAQRPQLLDSLARLARATGPVNITHYNIAPTLDVLAGVEGTDLGAVSAAVDKILERVRKSLPRGSSVLVRGQVESMNASFRGLGLGLIFAVVLVYLLMVVNFQSWVDPLIILSALPGALAGILWILYLTGTTLSVPALMGAIMSIGVATANSILVVTFANDQRPRGLDAQQAALESGMVRLRPVVMTALAMIIGMVPMALGFGEGGEQNAPLGRAVVGGLLLATLSTLFFVPVVYSLLRRRAPDPELDVSAAPQQGEAK